MKLAAEHVSVALGGREVLRDFSLSAEPGELIAVVGPNGAGKSTALKVLAGLLDPFAGQVHLGKRPLAELPRAEAGRHIAYLPQDRTVHWGIASEHVVSLGRLPHKSFASGMSEHDKVCVETAMARMDVAHLKGRSVARLSGGERARVLLARALAQEALFLIADEPTAGLDPAHALSLFEQLRELVREGRAVITALHDLALAARYATRVVLISGGACMADGLPAQVLSKENLASAFGIDAIVTQIDGLPVFLPRSPLRL